MGRAPQQPGDRQGDAALTIDAAWFPRPSSVADLEIVTPIGEVDASMLFELLVSTKAVEWRDKVGVAGRADGSGKPTTRLLATGGWLVKTNLAELEATRDALLARVLAERERGARAGVWHPSKQWALLRTAAGWLPLGICRELVTVRGFAALDERLRGWTRMLEVGLDVRRRCGLGLDLNPANFAVEPQTLGRSGAPIYYLDDELYPSLETRQLAFAVAARIPEEPDADERCWRDWGRELADTLDERGVPRAERAEVVDEILGYPLAEAFEARRNALVDGLRAKRDTIPVGVGPKEIVCVFADVHANLPALEAVLAAAAERGATRFLFLGDAVGYGPHPKECVHRLAELRDLTLVRGNHDHAISTGRLEIGMNRLARACAEWTRERLGAAELEWLGGLPAEHRGVGWMAVHGAPRDPNRFFAYVYDLTCEENLAHLDAEGVPLCFYGHTHVPLAHVALPVGPAKLAGVRYVELDPRWPTLVNPGSVGQPRDRDPRAAFALWDPASRRLTFERTSYDLERTVDDLVKADLPKDLVARLQEGL
jgi:diadenosine tetraphosphatase ApaH/serine/threonine PP2A family protein phosphatase